MLSLSALARELGRAKSGLHKLASTGQIPRNADGSFDINAVERAIEANVDPVRQRPRVNRNRVNGERSGVNDPVFACLSSLGSEADIKAVAMGLILAHAVGASMANMAIGAGAPIKVAFTLKDLAAVCFITHFEDAARSLGIPTSAITYQPDRMDDLDWPARARDVGEPVDFAAWATWSAERKRLLSKPSEHV